MIKIYYAETDTSKGCEPTRPAFQLAEKTKLKLANLRRKEDRMLLLTSMELVQKVLRESGNSDYMLSDLQYTKEGRPYFQDSTFDFNLSHTDDFVAVAYSDQHRVGIDAERIKKVELSDFEDLFPKKVWEKIVDSTDKEKTFYHYWTMLESALKADGRGLPLISTGQLEIMDNLIRLDGKSWFTFHLELNAEISCCIASDIHEENIVTRRIQII